MTKDPQGISKSSGQEVNVSTLITRAANALHSILTSVGSSQEVITSQPFKTAVEKWLQLCSCSHFLCPPRVGTETFPTSYDGDARKTLRVETAADSWRTFNNNSL